MNVLISIRTKTLPAVMLASLAIFIVAVSSGARGEGATTGDPQAAGKDAAAAPARSPIPYTHASIAAGRKLFATYCTRCHGTDGKAQLDVVANATDLTSPRVYGHGTSEGEIFHSIHDGAGLAMPAFHPVLTKDEDIWNLVNFVRSLWPETMRPELQDP
jgi:mono/diheme cytochrome c family protein